MRIKLKERNIKRVKRNGEKEMEIRKRKKIVLYEDRIPVMIPCHLNRVFIF